ncbi:hypothetical protein [Mycobacterium sp. SMC-8]|uniref:hypothetical protein n=1 Tax=Mycobacterium sp. SMC-8 TaxID=2857060 RepID=UPI0021B49C0E|nr:hypothetical protein [Mycobacterium sp. SMC-8]
MATKVRVLDPGQIVEAAIAVAGLDDFGDDDWQEGSAASLTRSTRRPRSMRSDARQLSASSSTCWPPDSGVVAHRSAHPDVATGEVVPPVVIVGQARTGTSILHDLMA